MHNAACMRGREASGYLRGIVNRLPLWDGWPTKTLAQRFSLQQLGDYIGRTVMSADIVNRQNVWMVQRACGLCFLFESPQSICVLRERRGQNFDCHIAVQFFVARAIHLPIPPSPIFKRISYRPSFVSDESVIISCLLVV